MSKSDSKATVAPADLPETKPRSDTLDAEGEENISALPSASLQNIAGTRNQNVVPHPQLGRSVSAGIYEDDTFLVNYQKFGRDGMPYVFDDRKTRKELCICGSVVECF